MGSFTKSVVLAAVVLVWTGCGSSQKIVGRDPSGNPIVSLKCKDIEDCYEDAADVCGEYGWSPLTQGEDVSASGFATETVTSFHAGTKHNMLVKCGSVFQPGAVIAGRSEDD